MNVLLGTAELTVTDGGAVLSLGVFEEQSHRTQSNVCDSDNECVQPGGNNEGGDYDFHC